MLETATIPIDVPKEPTDGFGPLKAVLGVVATIYTHHEVRLSPPA